MVKFINHIVIFGFFLKNFKQILFSLPDVAAGAEMPCEMLSDE
ncbi:MAG TPA: hypothetical protein PK704_03560 [Saprospiraceae bacterium]|nr:hypothetical protein [Saprospiraceae bacterium]